jgi:hypothetical protein
MVLPTSVEWGSAAVELCADELWTHGRGCPTAERSRPAVHELLPAKCQNGKRGVARAALVAFVPVRRRLPKSPGEYFAPNLQVDE